MIAYLIQSIYSEESDILILAVKSTRQDRGAVRVLVNKACTDAAKNAVMKILLEVRPNHLIARQFYASEGFLLFVRKNNYYRSCERAEDAFVIEQVLETAPVMMK